MFRLLAILYCPLFVGKKVLALNETDYFTISTKGCTIKRFSLNIDNIVNSPLITANCSEKNELVGTNSTHFWIIEDALDLFGVINTQEFSCCYKHFESDSRLENVVYSECVEFKSITAATHEFIRAECYYKDDKIYDNFFVFKSMRIIDRKHNNNTYNILIFGMESLSRMNFHRTMPKTSEYLRQRGSLELLGYNKIGDNSFPNLFPILTGNSFEFVKKTCYKNHGENNSCRFIWDKFKEAGYYTALGSDSVAGLLGEYEYNLTKIPTDFYLQPVMYEARNLFENKHYNYHQCLGSKYFYKILLNYIEGLTDTLKNNRLFGFFWEESISHENLNNPRIMDDDYLELLTNLEDSSYLDRTVIVLMSDHGMRWGDIVFTEQGKQEERLPLFQVLFPTSFKRSYKEAIYNFRMNRGRLTSPYDVYHTLMDIIDPGMLEDKTIKKRFKSGINKQASLFLPLSTYRTCGSLGIEKHWCACNRGRNLKVGSLARMIAAQLVINHVNELLQRYPQCRNLTLSRILEVNMTKEDGSWIYNVILETTPGRAILDGTVLQTRDTWVVSGTVSRLNRYQNDRCINDGPVGLYCYCR